MTILQAFKVFIEKLTGHEAIGNDISEVIRDGSNKVVNQKTLVKYEDTNNKSFVLKSSTASSNKQFRVTVDDTGTLTATEIV